MSALMTWGQLKEFADWTKIDAQHTLSGRLGRNQPHVEDPDFEGQLRYYDPQWRITGAPTRSGIRLVPGDFVGVLRSGTDPGSLAVLSLEIGDPFSLASPVSMAIQYVGGALEGVTVRSTEVWMDPDYYAGIDTWMYFLDSSSGSELQYTLQIVKIPVPPH
jgi:hypothetical protein